MAKDGRSSSPPSSSPPGRGHRSRSLSRSRRSRSRSRDSVDASNPGNNLYVTGLSSRVTESDLEKCFNREGKHMNVAMSQLSVIRGVLIARKNKHDNITSCYLVVDCHLVADPHSKESRGFGFVTMETNEGAERCIKYLNRSVLEGRIITVEKAKRKRGRTPTPGRYQGLADKRGDGRNRRRPRSFSPRRRYERDFDRRAGRGRSRSPYGRRTDDHSSSRRHRD